jgi:hypothetical protein
MTLTEKISYIKKLIDPYEKHNKKKLFIEQYLKGAGNELKDHFWAEISSSRMAFDLYSWMKNEASVLDIEFEFLLPGLASGGMGPNIDIYIETNEELIFIESKFTESANLHYIDNGYLSPGYYAPTHGKRQMILSKRFHNYFFADAFSKFCYDFESVMTTKGWHKESDWFEPKQETCHLLGLLFFIFDNRNIKRLSGKKIRLLNIFWKMSGDCDHSDLENEFEIRANNLISYILNTEKPNGIEEFKFGSFSVQEMLKDNSLLSKHIVFPEGFKEKFIERNHTIVKGRQRKGFNAS